MGIGIFHRYPMDLVVGTNPAFPSMLRAIEEKLGTVFFVSFAGNDQARHPGICFRELGMRFNRGNPWDKLIKSLLWILLSPFLARRLVKRDGVRLIYCDDSIPFYAFLIKLFVGRRCKVLMRLGDLQTGYMFAGQGVLKEMVFRVMNLFEVLMWKGMDGIIAISPQFKEFLIEKGVDAKKVSVVRECIDLDVFSRSKSGVREEYSISDDEILVLFHGAIEPCKGLPLLLGAARSLITEYDRLRFMVVGDGSSLKEAREFVDAHNMGSRVILTGWQSFSRMPEFVNAADIGIALRSDNMANNFIVTTALLQHWGCENPLLVPRLEAMAEVAHDGVNAVFFEAGNEEDLKDKLRYMIENRGMWRSLGKSGRETAARYFEKSMIGRNMAGAVVSYVREEARGPAERSPGFVKY